jgi:RNA-directed DNA polymerase
MITEGPKKGKYVITANTCGTPQGGVISPLLCNIALDGIQGILDTHNSKVRTKSYKKSFNKPSNNRKLHLVRYADDFVILSPSKD